MASIQTDRLILEPLGPEHAAKVFTMLSDARLYEFLDDDPPASKSILEARYRRWSAGRSPDGGEVWLNWAARLRDTGEYVGWFQATIAADHAQIAYLVFVTHQRKGYALEASREMIRHLTIDRGVKRIRATADSQNRASIDLALALGLRVIPHATDSGDVILEAT